MNEDLAFKIAMIVLLVLMKLARWPTRHLTGPKASWPAMKRDPGDTAILVACAVAWSAALVMYYTTNLKDR